MFGVVCYSNDSQLAQYVTLGKAGRRKGKQDGREGSQFRCITEPVAREHLALSHPT